MVDFIEEMSQDFLDYCYQTNVERAFPAIDGLKPGQRACLYEMYRKGYLPNKPHVKSAKVSGGVIAELWPHGDTAIYETFARMSQPFTNNSPLCEFHGSNGNQIIPEPASSRYTEVRLSKIGLELFENIKKKNVPFILNFDETVEWPEILPSPIPVLLINGSEGIGTTIAQKWLPYNATEAINAYSHYLETGEMDYSLTPSFPSGGIIINKDDAATILKTGKGKVILRAKAEINKNVISIKEICYQTCVRDLMEDFKKLFDADELPGVEDIQNMSGKNGVNIKIICEKDANPNVVLDILYQKTNLQKSYSANQNLLIDKVPQLVNTQQYFELLYKHNDNCLIREYNFDKDKIVNRLHILEGLLKALEDIDNVIKIIKQSESAAVAKTTLVAKYNFTEMQVKAILDMRLSKLAHLEGVEIQKEYNQLKNDLVKLNELLNNQELRKQKIIDNLNVLRTKYKTQRKTELTQIKIEKPNKEKEIIVPEDVVVELSQEGTIKKIPKAAFKVQKTKGKGIKNSDEIVLETISTNTVDTLMLFTDKGKMYRTSVDKVPNGTNTSKGTRIQDLIKLENGEKVIAMTSLYNQTDAKYVIFFTKKGIIKKTELEEYLKVKRNTGIQAIKLGEGDSIANITILNQEDVIILTKQGMGIRFKTHDINAIGRNAVGVKAIKLKENDEVVVGLPVHHENDTVAFITEKGLGKRLELKEIVRQGRGGTGTICYKTSPSTGLIAGAAMVDTEDKILIISNKTTICIAAVDIPIVSKIGTGNILTKNSVLKAIKL